MFGALGNGTDANGNGGNGTNGRNDTNGDDGLGYIPHPIYGEPMTEATYNNLKDSMIIIAVVVAFVLFFAHRTDDFDPPPAR